LEQKAAPYLVENAPAYDFDAKDVRLGALVAGMAYGTEFVRQLRGEEQKAFGTLTGPGGDFAVPEVIVAPFIDAVRPRTRVLQAGARTFPMQGGTVKLPGWDTPPQAAWAAEAGALQDAAGNFRAVVLIAKAVGCFVTINTELIEDAGPNIGEISNIIEGELARAIGQAIDKAALVGAGTASEPLGLYQTADSSSLVTVVSMGVNGATPTNYDNLIDLVAQARIANFEPNATLYAPRTGQTLGKLKDGQQRYLDPPAYLANVTPYETGQIPTNMTKGSSNDASLAFTGQWDQMLVGFRPDMGVRVLRDPYTKAATRQLNLYVWQRADIALLNKGAFAVLDGIRP
jgi:HK97 family phage major capsid protein